MTFATTCILIIGRINVENIDLCDENQPIQVDEFSVES